MRTIAHVALRSASGRTHLIALTAACSVATSLAVLAVSGFSWLSGAAVGMAAVGALTVLRLWAAPLRLSLDESRRLALTDELTGLGNRRLLLADLEHAISQGTDHSPAALAMFDLDGFKAYNDSHGHPAGDALLARLGARLASAFERSGMAYRLGGDEFCVLVRGTPSELEAALGSALEALTEEGSTVRSSCGFVLLPREARDAASALRIVDRRMYAQKDRRRSSSKLQARDLLLAVLEQHSPDVRSHSGWVSGLARAVAEHLGADPEQIEQVGLAAELHDIGNLAGPSPVLEAPGGHEQERELARRHSAAAEAILSAAPALAPVAQVVRSIRERVDGEGYPDGLEGEQIPLGARIVAVCDTYDALTSTGPDRLAIGHRAAIEEIVSAAGQRFDPRVVDALRAVIEHRPVARPAITTAAPQRPPDLSPVARIQGLVDVMKLVRMQEDVGALLDAIAVSVAEALRLGTVVINLYRPEWDDFWVSSVYGNEEVRRTLLGATYSTDWFAKLLDERFLRRGAYVVEQGSFDWRAHLGDRYVPSGPPIPVPNAWQPEDELFVPFRHSDGHILGVFSVGDPASGRRLSDEELDVLVAAATQAAVLVEGAQAAALAEARQAALTEFLAVSTRLVDSSSTGEVLRGVCSGISSALGFQKVAIELADAGARTYSCRAAVGWSPDDPAFDPPASREELMRLVDPGFEIAGCYLLPFEEGRRRFPRRGDARRSVMNGRGPHAWDRHWLLVPLRQPDGALVGVIWVDDPTDRLLPNPRILQALRLFANQAAWALMWARQRETDGPLRDAA
jgi:diguanylate cyclase (GGDEF)-like protein